MTPTLSPDERSSGLEAWKYAWRHGIALSLSTPGLRALRAALATGDPRLVQGYTSLPWAADPNTAPAAACAVGLAGWLGDGLDTIAAVEKAFVRVCLDADARLDEPAGCRYFLTWHDETPLARVRQDLLPEIDRELARRAAAD